MEPNVPPEYKLHHMMEKRIEAMLATTKDGYFVITLDGRLLDTNEAFLRMTGYSRSELLQLSIAHLDTNNTKTEMRAKINRLIINRSDIFETRYHKKNGSIFDVEISATYLPSENPEFICFCRDITTRKQAEEALRESENKYRLQFQTMTSYNSLYEVIMNSEGNPCDFRFIMVNRAYEDYVGKCAADLIGKTLLEVYPKTEYYWIEKMAEVALTGAPSHLENYSREMNIHTEISLYVPQKGQIAMMTANITERKKVEEEVAAEKERLAVTLRSIGDGVITTDTQGNVVIMNKVAEDLCGWKQSEAKGLPLSAVFTIIDQNSRMPHESPVAKVLLTGQIIELANHTLLISRDGTERIIADSGAPIMDKNSKIIGVVLVFRDMTEKHKLQENFQRVDKLNSLGVLAGGIAHDFNNLLGGIFGYLDMAREQSSANKEVTRYLDKALSVFNRAKDLTQQLLTFSKGGAPKRKTGQLGKLIRENACFVLSGTNVACDFAIADDLWPSDFDENQIGQVIDNIVLNAQQAMPIGGTIEIVAENFTLGNNQKPMLKAGNYLKIAIKDTGIGIPVELLTRIFDPFFTTKQKGNGLGLATCYSILQNHDGFIEVESVPGKGSTFTLYLPASLSSAVPCSALKATIHKGKGTILVMDDEDFIREIVGEMLSSMGYTVEEAKNGKEAIRLCNEAKNKGNPFSGAIFDLTIPGDMGGREAVTLLRTNFPFMPVFASSGFSEDPIMAKPTEFGFTDSIRKPFKKNELAELLNHYFISPSGCDQQTDAGLQ